MKTLLLYPKCPDTFWSFSHALGFISKKAVHPPLGLLTVAALLPPSWEKRILDMNLGPLRERDLQWADVVFLSAMTVQRGSVREVIARCRRVGVRIVAGGPLFTAFPDEFGEVDHLLLGEAERTLPSFLEDLERGQTSHLYRDHGFPSLRNTPVPLWELLPMRKYVSMSLQYSRGCPFDCEFCDITTLFGRNVRTKSADQVLAELEELYRLGWRGSVFFVDDNFIGNRKKLKHEILPAMIDWMSLHKYPFSFSTEASIDLSDDKQLMEGMVAAGFDAVFVGIESPEDESLAECNKLQNRNRDLIASVKRIQASGLRVRGGFIVGFDHDSPKIFDRQIEFIQKSGIITAMVGILNAPRGTRLYRRISQEGRLLKDISGENTDLSINFVPKMGYRKLIDGYRKIICGIYGPEPYFRRVKKFLREYIPLKKRTTHFHLGLVRCHFGYSIAFFKSVLLLGIRDKERIHYWKLFFWTLFRRPGLFPMAIAYAIYGFHFRKVFENCF